MSLSVSVAAYNIENYIEEALNPFINVKNRDKLEVLIVDDGSTDNSLEILKKTAKSDKRFRVIDKKNSGYGASLNLGLNEAKGDYIGIVEPDDFIHRDFYKTLFDNSSADVIKASFMRFSGRTWKSVPERVFHEVRKDFPVNGIKIKPEENKRIFIVDPTIWSAVYKKTMLMFILLWLIP